MHTFNLRLLVSIALLGCLRVNEAACQSSNYAQDSSFFKAQLPEFQRWLDQTGMGKTLRVREFEADTMLKLYLQFQYSDPDSVQNAWETLKIAVEQNSAQPLESILFFRAMGCFDVDRDHLSVRIYDTYDLDKDYCFKRKIYASHNIITVDSVTRCRGPVKDFIPIQPGHLQIRKGQKTPQNDARVSKQAVFEASKNFLRQRFASKTCAGRTVRTEFTIDAPNLDDLEFVVFNLCDEIISEQQPGFCAALQYFGHDCNWKKNEKITIRLNYRAQKPGFILDIAVEGRYGSGFYETEGRRGYHDMETDFGAELNEYAKRFKSELNAYLLKNL